MSRNQLIYCSEWISKTLLNDDVVILLCKRIKETDFRYHLHITNLVIVTVTTIIYYSITEMCKTSRYGNIMI